MTAFQQNNAVLQAGGEGFNQAGVAAALFGARIGGQLLPMLDAGPGAMEAFTAAAEKMGLGSEAQVAHLEAWNAASATLHQSLQGLGASIGSDVAPMLTTLADGASKLVGVIEQIPAPVRDTGLELAVLGGSVIAAVGAWERFGPALLSAAQTLG